MIAGKRKKKNENRTLKGKKWHIKSLLIVGTFSGYTGDLHPFVVIFVTKVHMPSPLRTPGRRLDMGGGSGDISGS